MKQKGEFKQNNCIEMRGLEPSERENRRERGVVGRAVYFKRFIV